MSQKSAKQGRTVEVIHEGPPAGPALYPDPYSKKSLRNADFLFLQPYHGGWIVSSHGEHMGFVKKLSRGWKIEPYPLGSTGRQYESCKTATELLDQYFSGDTPRAKDHVHIVESTPGVTSPEIPIEEMKDTSAGAKDCGCAPKLAVVRPDTYEACLARAASIGPITSTQKVWDLLGEDMSKEEQEIFVVVPLDARYQLRGGVIPVHKGARAAVAVSPSEILKAVLLASADRFLVVHNHPSGKCTPSEADKDLTKHISKATKTLQDVVFLDHVVIGRKCFFSICENKLYKAK